MDEMEKPETHGSPSEKAREALGEKLNRPAKPPPPLPGANEPPARRVTDEVNDL